MKKLSLLVLTFLVFLGNVYAIEFDLNSKNAILYNLDEDKILYEKNSDEEVAIASLTKIMTAIVSIENINDLDEKVTLINSDFDTLYESNASVAGFKVGEELTYRDLLYGLLLPSGADAAQALTRLIGGTKNNFINMMNEKAKALGMEHTHFVNETGLDVENHYSTVKDVAKMFKYALANETLKEIMQTKTYQTTNKNHILRSTVNNFKIAYDLDMDYLLGGKTGTTKNAGRCLASFATYNGSNYMFVTVRADVTNTPYTMLDHEKVYTYFMDNYETKTIISKGDEIITLPTVNAKEKEVVITSPKDILKYVPKEFNKDNLTINYDGIKSIPFNMKKGSKLGTYTVLYNDEVLLTSDVILNTALTLDIISFAKNNIPLVIGLILAIILTFTLLITLVHKKRKKKHNI